mgnify:CR=1 FL=1
MLNNVSSKVLLVLLTFRCEFISGDVRQVQIIQWTDPILQQGEFTNPPAYYSGVISVNNISC